MTRFLFAFLSFSTIFNIAVNCLHEDQVGKFDWTKQYIGEPIFAYHDSTTQSLILGTKENVIASLSITDGHIRWRNILPKACNIGTMFALKSSEEHLIRTTCINSNTNASYTWNIDTGLLAHQSIVEETINDDQAESIPLSTGNAFNEILNGNEHIKQYIDANKDAILKIFIPTSDDTSDTSQDSDMILVLFKDLEIALINKAYQLWTRQESLASIQSADMIHWHQDKFGLRKLIIAVTRNGNVLGIDTFSGDIVWKILDENLSTLSTDLPTRILVLKETLEETRVAIVHSKGYIITIDPINFKRIDQTHIPSIKQISLTELDSQSHERSLIMLDINDKVHIYPKKLVADTTKQISKYYMVLVSNEKDHQAIVGYKFSNESDQPIAFKTWTFNINPAEKIIDVSIKPIDEVVHSPARVLGDRGVLYKYINPNSVAILTQGSTGDSCNPEYYTNIYLIDGITGSLIHSIHHPKAKAAAQIVYSENWLIYSFFNAKARRIELSSLEMFDSAQHHISPIFSSFSRQASIKPKLIEHKSFIFPDGIDIMVATTTLRAMTNRHLIAALPRGSLIEIPKIFIDPRRPINMLMEHREEGLIPYMPELPLPSENIINYNKTLAGIRNIITSPAILESTSLVFAYGLDLFFTRVTPSKTFDILKDDFDHVLISAVLIFLVVASYITKSLAQRKALLAAWK